jgi:hypothetical protein
VTNLDLCDGPECPRCGCRDTFILQRPAAGTLEVDPDGVGTWFTTGRAACNHCHTEFCFKESPPGPPVEHHEPPDLRTRKPV